MTRDTIVVALMILAFAWVVTVHVAIVFGLARRTPRWRALAAFVVLPLGPYWAWQERMRGRAVSWVGGAVVYAVTLALAFRGG